jgi:vanillate O-demethylase monooxygenase subunit
MADDGGVTWQRPAEAGGAGSVGAASEARFVRNAWYVALWSHELVAGKLAARTILNEAVLLFRRADGTVAAMADTCSHRFAPLSMGQLLPGDRVQCPYHGLEFGADGRCVHNPHGHQANGSGAIPAAAHLRSYPVVERHRLIWIWMGGKTPDPGKIPDYSCLDSADPLHVTEPGYLLMQAHYELVVDNLLDLSHICYLHAGLLGTADAVAAEISMVQTGDTVTVTRRSADAAMPSMLRLMGAGERGDQWTSISWFPPSCLLLDFGGTPTGAPKADGTGYLAIHLLTPETARTTHYNFTAVRFNVRTEGEAANLEIRGEIAAGRRFAFAEQDQPVIEAQQRRMDQAVGPLKPVLLAIDAGPVQYQRVLDRLVREDAF